MRARLAAAPRWAWLGTCSLHHLQEGVPEVVKKTCYVVKKNIFEGPQSA